MKMAQQIKHDKLGSLKNSPLQMTYQNLKQRQISNELFSLSSVYQKLAENTS